MSNATVDRFWSKVDKAGPTSEHRPDLGACWVWTGAGAPSYGRFHFVGKLWLAHRFAYITEVGAIPPDLDIDHLCRNPACVRPDHMEAVTPQINTLRGVGPSAMGARKTHCTHGHEFTPENTYIHPKRGSRQCRACGLRAVHEYNARKAS